jgi:hypothetical protein
LASDLVEELSSHDRNSLTPKEIDMSIFGSIMSKIFGGHEAAAATGGAQPASPSPSGSAPANASGAATAPGQPVDVEAILADISSRNPQQLNWRTSIVDLMKLLDLDSSLNARKELAQELHYTGDMNDSAAMNIWLHKQVMQKLADNGGKVPDDLKS